MGPRLVRKAGAGLAIVVTMLLTTSSVASATVHTYGLVLTDGTMCFGTWCFVTPNPLPATCPGNTSITGTIDDAATTDNMNASLSIRTDDFAMPFVTGRFVFTATGSATGTNAGNYGPATHTFTGLHFSTVAFTVRSIDPTTCVAGTTRCSGTATLTLSGGIINPSSLPWTPSQQAYVNSTAGQILTTTSCAFPWGLLLFPGAAWTLGPNAGSGDPGAIFHV